MAAPWPPIRQFATIGARTQIAVPQERAPGNSNLSVGSTHTALYGVGECPLFAHLRRLSDVSNRRLADVADRGLGRLNWADSRPKRVASGRTGPRAKAVIPLRGVSIFCRKCLEGGVIRATTLADSRHPFRSAAPEHGVAQRAMSRLWVGKLLCTNHNGPKRSLERREFIKDVGEDRLADRP
jgi:hypothetical protein